MRTDYETLRVLIWGWLKSVFETAMKCLFSKSNETQKNVYLWYMRSLGMTPH